MPDQTPLARTMLRLLAAGPRTADHLARDSHLPLAVAEWTLAGLRGAGLAEEFEPGKWRAVRERL